MSDTQTMNDSKIQYYSKSDIHKTRERAGKELPLDKVYDPEFFWNDLGDEYYKAFVSQQQLQANTSWMIDRLKVLGVSTLLDAGCGFGRVLPFLLEAGVIKSANGIDISESILKSSEDYLNPTPSETMKIEDYRKKLADSNLDSMLKVKMDELLVQQHAKRKASPPDFRDKIRLKKGDVRKLDAESESFDAVLSSETLQHLCPQDAEDALLHLVRVARKAVILVERGVYFGEHSQPDLWSHNYSEMLNNLGVNIAQSSSVSNGVHGIIALKR